MTKRREYRDVNKNPESPSFPVENNSDIEEYVKGIVTPIFDEELKKVAKEMPKNRMSVGVRSVSDSTRLDISLYQPHNYRLYFDFDKKGFKPPRPNQTEPFSSVDTTYKLKNGIEHFFRDYFDCTVTVKKNQVEIINKVNHKKWYVIKHLSLDSYEVQVKSVLCKKDEECLGVLKAFVKEFGGFSNFKILNRRSEDKVRLENSIDKLPMKQVFHGRTVKKVYNEENVEFGDPVFAVNYFENRAIENISPQINRNLGFLHYNLNTVEFLDTHIKSKEDFFRWLDVNKPKFNRIITEDVWDWFFYKFGISY